MEEFGHVGDDDGIDTRLPIDVKKGLKDLEEAFNQDKKSFDDVFFEEMSRNKDGYIPI